MQNAPWWKRGVIYQIYPRSYQDSNGDGVGDLRGIISRLDYVKSLGVEAIWLSPIYPSPMYDFGYDVSNYTGIHPLFGDMDDFDELLREVHRRDMKLLLDLVPNHSSHEHNWFIESRSSTTNPKRDYYIWRDPAPDGGPPNNWLSFFGGPAWRFDGTTGQYYLHQFLPQQPDLNYDNPVVFQEMMRSVRFWLDKGVDGFRIDVIWVIKKDSELRDEPENPEWNGVEKYHSLLHVHTQNVPGVHSLIKKMRSVFDEYDERVMVGEIYLPIRDLVQYYGDDDECHLPFNFSLIRTKWGASTIRDAIVNYEDALPAGAWPNWVLGNHDNHRIATRVGKHNARVANMLLLTLRGTPTTYYGEEIAMENVPISTDMVQDPFAKNVPEIAHIVGRDPERTPMLWDDSPNAGFTEAGVQPWLPVTSEYERYSVMEQEKDGASVLALYRALASLRASEPALCLGSLDIVLTGDATVDEHVLCYVRRPDSQYEADGADVTTESDGADVRPKTNSAFLVVLNFDSKDYVVDLERSTGLGRCADVIVATDMVRCGPVDLSRLNLRPNEGLVLELLAADN